VASGSGTDLWAGEKSYQRRKLIRVTQVMRLGTSTALKVALQGLGFSGRLNTAFIERVNLTVRHGVAALARRTWATVQQAPQLSVHLVLCQTKIER
jgi:IS1 family transposase